MRLLPALFASICLLLFPHLAVAGTGAFYGRWAGGGKAADAIYGTMDVSKLNFTWKGNNGDPRCTVSYEQIHEGYGVEFKDQTGNSYVTAPDSTFKTYLLKINGGKCALGVTHFRLTIRDELPNYLAMIEYKGLDHPMGRMHFFKLADDSGGRLTLEQAIPDYDQGRWLKACGKEANVQNFMGLDRKAYMESCLGKELHGSVEQWQKCLDTRRETNGLAYAQYLKTCLSQ